MTSAVIGFRINRPLSEAESAVRQALQEKGFGILTEVDVTQVLRQKLGIETRPQKLLGACNPRIAHASLEADPRIGAYLPCGLSLREDEDGVTFISLQNPTAISEFFDVPGLEEPASQARTLLEAALSTVATPVGA
jgi:uncharacterized protein (DUF302 family)